MGNTKSESLLLDDHLPSIVVFTRPASFRLSEGQFKEHFLQTQMAVKSDLPKDGPQGARLERGMDRNS